MSIISIIIGVCIVGIGIWTAQNQKDSVSSVVDVHQEISPTEFPSVTPSLSETPTPTDQPTKTPTSKPAKEPTIKIDVESNSNSSVSVSLSKFQYPGASVNSSSNSRLELSSTDSPKAVTDWYKNTINSTGMNVKSFVTTSTNNNVVNKLVAAHNDSEVRVDITRAPSDSTTKIVVELN